MRKYSPATIPDILLVTLILLFIYPICPALAGDSKYFKSISLSYGLTDLIPENVMNKATEPRALGMAPGILNKYSGQNTNYSITNNIISNNSPTFVTSTGGPLTGNVFSAGTIDNGKYNEKIAVKYDNIAVIDGSYTINSAFDTGIDKPSALVSDGTSLINKNE